MKRKENEEWIGSVMNSKVKNGKKKIMKYLFAFVIYLSLYLIYRIGLTKIDPFLLGWFSCMFFYIAFNTFKGRKKT